jgi:hypothetical protein
LLGEPVSLSLTSYFVNVVFRAGHFEMVEQIAIKDRDITVELFKICCNLHAMSRPGVQSLLMWGKLQVVLAEKQGT